MSNDRMIRVDLDDTGREILLTTLASPKTATELARILDLPVAIVMEYLDVLERTGMVRVVLSYWGREGRIHRYYEADLPVDTSDMEREEVTAS